MGGGQDKWVSGMECGEVLLRPDWELGWGVCPGVLEAMGYLWLGRGSVNSGCRKTPLWSAEGRLEWEEERGNEGFTSSRKSSLISQSGPCATS